MMTTQSNKRTAQQRGRAGGSGSRSGSGSGSMKSAGGRHGKPHTKNNNNSSRSSNRGDWTEWALRNYFGSLPVVKVWGLALALALGLSHCVAWLPGGMQCERATGQKERGGVGSINAGCRWQTTQSKGESRTHSGRQAGRYQAAKLNACFVCKAIGQLLDFDWNLKTRKCENVEIVKMLRCENKRQLTSDRLRT